MKVSFKNEVLKLVGEGKTYAEISEILGCAKSTVSFHCRQNKVVSLNIKDKPNREVIAKFQVIYDSGKSVSQVAKITGWSKSTILKHVTQRKKENLTKEELRKNGIQAVITWRKKAKLKLVEYKGGKCEKCGYSKYIEVLEFHHLDPKNKDFSISGKSWSLEKLKKEVDKCILVCSNCHKEIHVENNILQ